MNEDIYENPDFNTRTTNVKTNEKLSEDIYVNEDNPGTNQPVCHRRTITSGSSSKETICCKTAVLCMSLLCALLLIVVAKLSVYTNNQTTEQDQLQTCYSSMTKDKDQLQSEIDELKKKLLELEKDITQSGWIKFMSSFYYISTHKRTWSESRDDCVQRGAHLVIITTQEEQDFVKSLKYNEKVWIGLNDLEEEGKWKWVDGSALNTAFWNVHEPGGNREENCVVTGYETDPSRNWMDFPCDWTFLWICEKKSC